MTEQHSSVRRIGERVVRAMVIVGLFHFFWKLGGFAVTILVNQFYGSTARSDAYFYAIEGIVLVMYFIVEESMGPAFLPVFIREMEEQGERKAWEFASSVLNLLLIVLAAWCVIALALAPQIVDLAARGFKNREDQETIRLTVHLVRYAVPGLIGLALGSVTYVIINGYKVFSFPAAGDTAQKFLTFASMLVAFKWLGMGLDAAAVGFLAGAVGKIATHFIWLRRKLIFYRLKIVLRSRAMKQFGLLMLPLLLGIVFAKFRDVITDRFASFLAEGIPADIKFGRKIGNLSVIIVPYALSIAIFPYLCDLWAKRDVEGLGRVVTRGLDLVALFFIPLSITMMLLSEPIVQFIYNRGALGVDHIQYRSAALAVYVSALAFYGAEMVLMQSFFSMQNTWVPVAVGVLSSGVTILILYVSIVVMGMKGAASFFPVIIAFPVGKVFKNIVLGVLMRRKVPILPWRTFSRFLARLAVVSAGVGVSTYAVWRVCQRFIVLPAVPAGVKFSISFELVKAVRLALPSLAAFAAFVLLASLLRMEEFQMVVDWLKTKLRGRGRRGARQ